MVVELLDFLSLGTLSFLAPEHADAVTRWTTIAMTTAEMWLIKLQEVTDLIVVRGRGSDAALILLQEVTELFIVPSAAGRIDDSKCCFLRRNVPHNSLDDPRVQSRMRGG